MWERYVRDTVSCWCWCFVFNTWNNPFYLGIVEGSTEVIRKGVWLRPWRILPGGGDGEIL